MRKTIAFVKDHAALKDKFDLIGALEKECEDQMSFLRKKAEKINAEARERKAKLWAEVEEICTKDALFPAGYDKAKFHMHFDRDIGVLIACDEHGLGLAGILGGLVT